MTLRAQSAKGPEGPVSDNRSVAAKAVERAFRLGDIESAMVASIVAERRGFTVAELFQQTRSRAPVAVARQMAMYLMHVSLSRSFTQVGDFYGRDRTTVSHACEVIEDMRDNPEFEMEISALEEQIAVRLAHCENTPGTAEGAANDR